MTADIFITRMMEHFNVFTLNELADKIGISQQAISGWKKKNAVLAIKKRCRELGIFNEIFGDLNTNVNNQTIRDNHGNNSQTGDVFGSKENDDANIDNAALSTFKRAYSKCVDENGDIIEDKLDELIIYLTKFK